MKKKKLFLSLLIVAAGLVGTDQAILHLYINKYFSNPDDYKKTEICKYAIQDHSLSLDKTYTGAGCFSGPMYDLQGKTVGGALGFKDNNKPILTHEQCCAIGYNFNLDSVTYIMCIDTLTCAVRSFPSYDKKYGDMAYNKSNDADFIKNKIILQNGNYLMMRGGIPPKSKREKSNGLQTLKLAFGVDGDGNYVFVKFFGTMCELQEYLKREFGRGNPNYKNDRNSKYAKAAFMYLDGNNIIFDGKCYVARRKSFIKDKLGFVKLAKLRYIQHAPHLNIKQK